MTIFTVSRVSGWRSPAAGQTIAITASTNAHVDAINAAIQAARLDAGHLDPARAAVIGSGGVRPRR